MDIYIVWDMKADSWNSLPSIVSMHKTFEGADASIPDNIRKMTRLDDDYVANYTYLAIERKTLED